ncbi:MAG: hypothetical protein L6V84_00490 [Oscillospiraceae bacterium]|nr:MAG: hypothetical protein L6V84_00490 [Oscillospiraceae bacterium]
MFGVTVGIYIESFTLNKKPLLSVWLPSVSAAVVTLVMYIGEMILLSGHLYRFGDGFFFAGIPGIVLAPVDIVVILGSGVMTAIIASFVRNKKIHRFVYRHGIAPRKIAVTCKPLFHQGRSVPSRGI